MYERSAETSGSVNEIVLPKSIGVTATLASSGVTISLARLTETSGALVGESRIGSELSSARALAGTSIASAATMTAAEGKKKRRTENLGLDL